MYLVCEVWRLYLVCRTCSEKCGAQRFVFVFVWGMSAVCSLGFGECTSCPSIDASSPLPPLSFYFEFFQQDFDLNCQILEFDRKQLEAPSLLWLQLLLVNQPNKQRQNTFQIINVFTAQTACMQHSGYNNGSTLVCLDPFQTTREHF